MYMAIYFYNITYNQNPVFVTNIEDSNNFLWHKFMLLKKHSLVLVYLTILYYTIVYTFWCLKTSTDLSLVGKFKWKKTILYFLHCGIKINHLWLNNEFLVMWQTCVYIWLNISCSNNALQGKTFANLNTCI